MYWYKQIVLRSYWELLCSVVFNLSHLYFFTHTKGGIFCISFLLNRPNKLCKLSQRKFIHIELIEVFFWRAGEGYDIFCVCKLIPCNFHSFFFISKLKRKLQICRLFLFVLFLTVLELLCWPNLLVIKANFKKLRYGK